MDQAFSFIKTVNGELEFSGDKSISHRALMISAIADGKSVINNLSGSEDVSSTINCLRNIGCSIEIKNDLVIVNGCGYKGFKKSDTDLYAGNSGTTARLLTGILAPQNFESRITGDTSLSKRPMKRILEPLHLMGAVIKSAENFSLPLSISTSDSIHSINYNLPIPSAQVKSSILFCGLHSETETTITEKSVTRDHTERMLGLQTDYKSGLKSVKVSKSDYPEPGKYFVPGDISSAAYFVVLTLLSKDSSLHLKNISLNPTRIGFIELLKKMGADISTEILGESNNEPYGSIVVKSSSLKNINIDEAIIPNIIDEIPILSIVGIFAEGDFSIRNVSELRVKESDRISSLCSNLKLLGLKVNEYPDGFEISGKIKNQQIKFNSFGDHRIAMAFGILSCLLKKGSSVAGFDCAAISNPDFISQLNQIKN